MKKLKEFRWERKNRYRHRLFIDEMIVGSIWRDFDTQPKLQAMSLNANSKNFLISELPEAKAWVGSQVRTEIASLFEEEV